MRGAAVPKSHPTLFLLTPHERKGQKMTTQTERAKTGHTCVSSAHATELDLAATPLPWKRRAPVIIRFDTDGSVGHGKGEGPCC